MDESSDPTRDTVRGLVLSQARDAVRSFAMAHGFLDAHLCGCGRPTCLNDNPATMSLVAMLRAVSTGWTDGPDPAGELLLRERLLAFARTFALDNCPNGDPACHCAKIEGADARGVLRTVADAWHGRAGNVAAAGLGPHAPPALSAESIVALATDHARHLAALDALAILLDPASGDVLLRITERVRENAGGAWLEEARCMAAEAIASWMPRPDQLREVGHVLDGALAVAFHQDWTVADADDLHRASADACSAILVRGICHESVSEILYRPFAGVVSMDDLDAYADAEWLSERPVA